jgi:hypothetical protein
MSVASGRHHVSFDGRLRGTDLPAGTYSVAVSAAGRGHARPQTHTLHFTIVG